jgi:hypothetical protein
MCLCSGKAWFFLLGSAEFGDTVFAARSLSFKGTFVYISFLLETAPFDYKTVPCVGAEELKMELYGDYHSCAQTACQ